jgi:arsenate reductase
MAEGWTRHLLGDFLEPHSAGVAPKGVDPVAVEVMAEAGVDISSHRSKHVEELEHLSFYRVVTVCGHAHEHCPVFPGTTRVVHAGFDDPPALAPEAGNHAERLAPYRRVRDEIRAFVETLPGSLERPKEDALG